MAKRQLVTFKAPAMLYKPANGSVLWEARKWLSMPPALWLDAPERDWKIIPLFLISQNTFRALLHLELSLLSQQLLQGSMYECPYTGYMHFGVVPHSIVTLEPEKYRKAIEEHCGTDPMALDFEFMEEHWGGDYRDSKPNDIQLSLLGPGFTYGTIKSDGHGKIKGGVICLSNGDYLRVNFWEWYNK